MFESTKSDGDDARRVGIEVVALLIVIAVILIALALWNRLRERRLDGPISGALVSCLARSNSLTHSRSAL